MSYGVLYFSMRYYDPFIGGVDYFTYQRMITSPLDFSTAGSPFIYRQFSICIAAIYYKLNIFYDIGITFGETLQEKKIFFSLLLSNYTALLFTAILTLRVIDKEVGKTVIASLFTVLILFLSFGTINYVLVGLVEGWTWFFVLLSYHALKTKNILLFSAALTVSIFQKELITIVVSIFSVYYFTLSIIRKQKEYEFLTMSILSFLSVIVYILIRTTIIATPGYETQLKPLYFINTFLSLSINKTVIINIIASQNLIIVFIATSISFYLILRKPINEMKMYIDIKAILIVSLFLTVLGVGNKIGNNLGRILLIFTPILGIIIVSNLVELDNYLKLTNNKPS
jgi:hypothetical protein